MRIFAYNGGTHGKNDSSAFEWWHGPLDEVRSEYLYRPPALSGFIRHLSKQLMSVSIRLSVTRRLPGGFPARPLVHSWFCS